MNYYYLVYSKLVEQRWKEVLSIGNRCKGEQVLTNGSMEGFSANACQCLKRQGKIN